MMKNIITTTLLSLTLSVTGICFADTSPGSKKSAKYVRAQNIISKSVKTIGTLSSVNYYDKRTGKIGIIETPNLVFFIGNNASAVGPAIDQCGEDLFCCADYAPSGCTDFIFACDELGGQPVSLGGGQFAACDCSDSDGNGHPQC